LTAHAIESSPYLNYHDPSSLTYGERLMFLDKVEKLMLRFNHVIPDLTQSPLLKFSPFSDPNAISHPQVSQSSKEKEA
jgi:hypothetical protein